MRKFLTGFILLCLVLLCCFPGQALAAESAGADIPALLARAEQTVAAHIEGLRDDYSYYFTAEEYDLMFADYQGEFGGVGLSMIDNEAGEVVIYSLIHDTPAARSNSILPGDVILAVDGESLAGLDSSLAALRIRGEAGTAVTLTLRQAETGLQYEITLVRELIHTESVTAERLATAPDVAYFSVYDFTEQTAADFAELYNTLQAEGEIKHLVIDLRSNGGGSFFAAINIANYFVLPGETIVSEKTSQGREDYTSVSGELNGLDLYVLMNNWSASASEVLAGALRDNAGAVLVGSQSYGKGITQGLVRLDSGAGLRYTRSRYYTPAGFDLHGLGLAPDIPVEDPADIGRDAYFSYDPALNPHLQAVLDDIAAKATL